MTSEQYRALLQELAHVGGLSDATSLLEHGRVMIGELSAVLEHEPRYDEHLLQVRFLVGSFPQADAFAIAKSLLEANYVGGYGGECVFSVVPDSDDVVVTLKVHLHPSLTAQELWQDLSAVARHASELWEQVASSSLVPNDAHPSQFQPAQVRGA